MNCAILTIFFYTSLHGLILPCHFSLCMRLCEINDLIVLCLLRLTGIYLRLAIIVYRLLKIWRSRNLREDCLARSSISPIFIGESMCIRYTGSVREYPVLGIHNGRDAVSIFSWGGASFSIFIWPPPPLIILFHFWCTLILETYIFLNNFI